MSRLSTNLSHAMDEQGYTNARLAALLGVSRQAVQTWRHGTGRPSQEHVAALSEVLRCNLRKSVFATNLTDLMAKRPITDEQLGAMGVSRETVQAWCEGTVKPGKASMEALCAVLECDLRKYLRKQKMLSIGAWARRERIPVARARDLFDLKLLTGEHRTLHTLSVPASVRAPADSKSMVTTAKRRPSWVTTFHENFPRMVTLLQENGSQIATIASLAGVQSAAVYHWKNARTYPAEERLPLIAEALGVTVEELAGSTACDATQRNERL